MAQRYSASQIRSKLRQVKQKRQQAVNKYNQAVRRYNQGVKNAVNKYNQDVRRHNARVRANRQRVKSELARFGSQPTRTTSTRRLVYRTSVETLHRSYTRLEHQASSEGFGPQYNRFLDLSELETANSLEVANRLFGHGSIAGAQPQDIENAELLLGLRSISPDLDQRWRGAIYALNPRNPDAARHFCTSAREIMTQILDIKSPDSDVFALLPNCDVTENGNPTRRSKIRYFLHRRGMNQVVVEEFVDSDLENIVQLFHILNDGTHGTAGKFDLHQLSSIKKRVEDGITFLIEIVGDT